MLLIEVIEQYQLGKLVVDVAVGKPRSRDYDRQLRRYLRIVGSKDHIQKFIARLQAVRRKSLFPRFSLPAPTTPMNSTPFSPPGGQPSGAPTHSFHQFANGGPTPAPKFDVAPRAVDPPSSRDTGPAAWPPHGREPMPGGSAAPAGCHAAPRSGHALSSAHVRYCGRCCGPVHQLAQLCPRCGAPLPSSADPRQAVQPNPETGQGHSSAAVQTFVNDAVRKLCEIAAEPDEPEED